jgi:hypothetical protein
MASQESIIREQCASLLSDFTTAFPDIQPPDYTWWLDWMKRYDCGSIHEAIITLSQHHLKAQFTTASTGRAISALLREIAMRRAIVSSIPKVGGAL